MASAVEEKVSLITLEVGSQALSVRIGLLGIYKVYIMRTGNSQTATVVLWKSGKLLLWDATCLDVFSPSYVASAVSEAGVVDGLDEEKKEKYCNLVPSHLFTPVPIELSGSFGPQTLDFVKELDHCLR